MPLAVAGPARTVLALPASLILELGLGNQLCFWCGFPRFHIAMLSRHHSFSTKEKARNKVVFMEKITPHGAVEEQC
jgi:hypothetical protein